MDTTAQQIYHRIQELKLTVSAKTRKKNLLHDPESWKAHQELQGLFQTLLVKHIDYALGKKAEIDLWNYCFKDYVTELQKSAANRAAIHKKSAAEAKSTCATILDMAIGFYIAMLGEIRPLFDLEWPFYQFGQVHGLPSKPVFQDEKEKSRVTQNCVYLVQHCLVHLGDLSRYKKDWKLAEKYYRMATQVAPQSGQAYNQLAVLEANSGHNLAAIFFHVRALALKHPFPSASTNIGKLYSRVEAVHKKDAKLKDANKIDSSKFFSYALLFQSYIHGVSHLKSAAKICHLLNESLTHIIAKSDLDPSSLLQLTTITIFLVERAHQDSDETEEKSKDEVRVTELLLESIAGMLNALLIPVYTIKQGEALLEYFAMPTIKLILDWICLNPWALEEKAFLKRVQIWPSLCKVLNDLSNLLTGKEIADQVQLLAEFSTSPLPEDFDIEGFLPVKKRQNNFRGSKLKVKKIPNSSTTIVRAQRIIEIGKFLSSGDFKSKKVLSSLDEDLDGSKKVKFEAIEQQIPPELLKELEALNLESSSEEESEEELPAENASPSNDKENVVSDSGSKSSSLPSEPATEDPSKKKKTRNVAMEAILKQAEKSDEVKSRQVSFQSPTPENPPNSREKSSYTNREIPPRFQQLAARNAQMRPMTLRPQMDGYKHHNQGQGQYGYGQRAGFQPRQMTMRPRMETMQQRPNFSMPPPMRMPQSRPHPHLQEDHAYHQPHQQQFQEQPQPTQPPLPVIQQPHPSRPVGLGIFGTSTNPISSLGEFNSSTLDEGRSLQNVEVNRSLGPNFSNNASLFGIDSSRGSSSLLNLLGNQNSTTPNPANESAPTYSLFSGSTWSGFGVGQSAQNENENRGQNENI